jgi:hypothetical protein
MRSTQRVLLLVAVAFVAAAFFVSTRHVVDRGYDCGTAFAQHETVNGLTEASVFGATLSDQVDCGSRIRDQRAIAGGLGAIGVIIAAGTILSGVHIGASQPSPRRETFRLNG